MGGCRGLVGWITFSEIWFSRCRSCRGSGSTRLCICDSENNTRRSGGQHSCVWRSHRWRSWETQLVGQLVGCGTSLKTEKKCIIPFWCINNSLFSFNFGFELWGVILSHLIASAGLAWPARIRLPHGDLKAFVFSVQLLHSLICVVDINSHFVTHCSHISINTQQRVKSGAQAEGQLAKLSWFSK